VDVSWRSGGGGPARSAQLIRAPITLRAVSSALCDPLAAASEAAAPPPRVGYIRVGAFSAATPSGVSEALGSLTAGGAEAIVMDLRSNGGGSFPAGVAVAKLLLSKGVVVYIADSDGVRDIFDAAGPPVVPASLPLAVLVDKGTASAAEVLAGALRDNGRARLLGERTFGKGIIQTTVELSDGSAVNVTVAKYQTPSGADINKVGISPDAPAPLPDAPPAPAGFCEALMTAGAPAAAALFPAQAAPPSSAL
jgi:C-terminal peptidase prc